MSDQARKKPELFDYLLGNIQDPTAIEEIEEQIMLSDSHFKELVRQEDELIQKYADNELTADEQKKFEEHFLISDERLKKLEFAKVLRKYVDAQEIKKNAAAKTEEKRNWRDIFKFFLSPLPVGVGLAVIVFASLLIWYLYSRPSAADLAMNSLNQAYQQERPFESRVTNFDYAPFYRTRSEKENTVNIDERNRAELNMLTEIQQNPTAENIHALGRVELAKKDFDKAIERFEKAKALDSQNAGIFNDLGVAYLEKYKISKDDKNNNPQVGIQALDFFDSAIKLNPGLKEAYFNRADALQTLNLSNEAIEAWKKYLEIDSKSRWAEEAKKHLDDLQPKTSADIPTDKSEQEKSKTFTETSADKLEQEFILAFKKKTKMKPFGWRARTAN